MNTPSDISSLLSVEKEMGKTLYECLLIMPRWNLYLPFTQYGKRERKDSLGMSIKCLGKIYQFTVDLIDATKLLKFVMKLKIFSRLKFLPLN